jgi:transposase
MDLKTSIINLHQEGMSADEIRKALNNYTGYVYRVLGDLRRSKENDMTNVFATKERKRSEMARKEKEMKILLPFENEKDKEYFHLLEKDLLKLRGEINYLDKKISKANINLM